MPVPDDLRDEHKELVAEQAALNAEHEWLRLHPEEQGQHRLHIEKLRAHISRLHAYAQKLHQSFRE
jgi:hypothetical protein